MLDIISMTTLLVFYLLILTIYILFLMGSNMNKSEEERKLEDEEQIKYLRKYNENKK